MARSPKLKTKGANLPVPQTTEQAADAIFEIGTIDRNLQRLDADLKDALAAVKRRFEEKSAPLKEQKTALMEGVKIFCEARRDELTGGKSKTIAFTTGEVSWRFRPPSVKVIGGDDNLLGFIQNSGLDDLQQFVRVKYEINREAMREDPATASTLPGVHIGSAGEDFEVKPFAPQGIEGRAA